MSSDSPSRPITIVLDQTCASLAERIRALGPVHVFTRAGSVLTRPDLAVDELRASLQPSGSIAPSLIVAASFAGFTALLYAARYPAEVAGLVLVDSSHPRQSEVTLAVLAEADANTPGIVAFKTFLRGPGAPWEEGCRLLSDLNPLGDLPIIALAAGAPAIPAALPAPIRMRLIETWHALQQDHAARSTQGELRIVKGCGHALAAEAPDAIVAAVEDLFQRLTSHAPTRATHVPRSETTPRN